MGDDVCVKRSVVLQVLELTLGATKVKAEDNAVTIYAKDTIRTWLLPEDVPSRFVREIANRYGISTHLFFHPEMLHKDPGGKAN